MLMLRCLYCLEQIKLLRILSIMGAGDRSASENMYAVINEAMNKANTGHNDRARHHL